MTEIAFGIKEMAADLGRIIGSEVLVNEPLAKHTSIGLGGPADLFVVVKTADQMSRVLQFCRERSLPMIPLGDGSNVLVSDRGVRGVVFTLAGDFDRIDIHGCRVTIGAGVSLSRAIAESVKAGLAGLEALYGVPGSVGGGVFMNAGTRYGWLSDCLVEVGLLHPDGSFGKSTVGQLGMSYRRSLLQEMNPAPVVLDAVFELKPEEPESIRARIAGMADARQASQPLRWRSCGCIFKNPEGDSAGRLIDSCGLKGLEVGGASVSDKHANFIIVSGEQASAGDVYALAKKVRSKVLDLTGIELEFEVRFMGEWPDEQS